MATPTKKSAAKSTAKKPAVARKATTKPVAKKQKTIAEQSFRASKETTPFMTFQFTRQSLYWLILSALVLALGAWVMYLNVKIQNIYDQVELNTYLHETYTLPQKEAPATEPAPTQQ